MASLKDELKDGEDFLNSLAPREPFPEIDQDENPLAFCELLGRNCNIVDCGRCHTLHENLPEGTVLWVCARCATEFASEFIFHPYWHDGWCDCCLDSYSIVLSLAILRPDDPDSREMWD